MRFKLYKNPLQGFTLQNETKQPLIFVLYTKIITAIYFSSSLNIIRFA